MTRYGLGTCYLRMSKIRLAEFHYRKAVEIHPNNAVLLGCVGMVSLFCFSNGSRYLYYLRLWKGVGIGTLHLPYSMKQYSSHLTTLLFAIGAPKSLSP